TPWSSRPSGWSGASRPKACAMTTTCASTWRPRWQWCGGRSRASSPTCPAGGWSGRVPPATGEPMQIRIDPAGTVTCVYGEEIAVPVLGALSIRRASHVEPDELGQWWADLSPVAGPRLGPFLLRSQALAAELAWLEAHWPRPATT